MGLIWVALLCLIDCFLVHFSWVFFRMLDIWWQCFEDDSGAWAIWRFYEMMLPFLVSFDLTTPFHHFHIFLMWAIMYLGANCSDDKHKINSDTNHLRVTQLKWSIVDDILWEWLNAKSLVMLIILFRFLVLSTASGMTTQCKIEKKIFVIELV